ncbi:hypothetical protein DL768_005794 [Monosporascus sp. mg162]|nr:hypothetical protein DL768_005794 [Monosporascus sp. mg162]
MGGITLTLQARCSQHTRSLKAFFEKVIERVIKATIFVAKPDLAGITACPAGGGAAAGAYEKWNFVTGDVYVGNYGADTELKRLLSTRHATMIVFGSSIRMELWLRSGTSLTSDGLAGKFDDPAAAFVLGWSYWFSYCITMANELQAANTIIGFRTKAFGEIEVVCSSIKFGWIFVAITSMILLSADGGNYPAVGFREPEEVGPPRSGLHLAAPRALLLLGSLMVTTDLSPYHLGHDLFIPHPDADGLGDTGPHGGGATLESLAVDMNTVDLDNGHRFYRDNDVEKAPAKGFLGKAKVVGYIFN